MEGTRPKPYRFGGHPAPTGPALPNLINAVRMFKVKTALVRAGHVGATVPVARKRGDCGTGRATGDGRPYRMVLTLTF